MHSARIRPEREVPTELHYRVVESVRAGLCGACDRQACGCGWELHRGSCACKRLRRYAAPTAPPMLFSCAFDSVPAPSSFLFILYIIETVSFLGTPCVRADHAHVFKGIVLINTAGSTDLDWDPENIPEKKPQSKLFVDVVSWVTFKYLQGGIQKQLEKLCVPPPPLPLHSTASSCNVHRGMHTLRILEHSCIQHFVCMETHTACHWRAADVGVRG